MEGKKEKNPYPKKGEKKETMSEERGEPERGKPEPQVIPKFKAGAHPVHVKIAMKPYPGVHGQFTHNFEEYDEMARLVGTQTYPMEQKLKSDPGEEDDFVVGVQRMFWAALAKKLASSFPSTFARMDDYSAIREYKMMFPTPFVTILDNFGTVFNKDIGEFRMIGHDYICSRSFFQAVVPSVYRSPVDDVAVPVNRETFWPVNTGMAEPLKPLLEYSKGQINDWARTVPPGQFAFGAHQITMGVPKFTSGMAGYAALVAGLNKPAAIASFIQIVAWIEGVYAVHQGFPNAADRAAGHLLNVYFYDWSAQLLRYHGAIFQDTILTDLELAFSNTYNYEPLRELKKFGTGVQFLRKHGEFAFASPFEVGGEDLSAGWMLASPTTSVEVMPNHRLFTSESTVQEQMIDFIRKAKIKH